MNENSKKLIKRKGLKVTFAYKYGYECAVKKIMHELKLLDDYKPGFLDELENLIKEYNNRGNKEES